MKTYSFIALIATALFLTSCTADNDETTYTKPEQAKQFDSFDAYAKEGDTIVMEGEPIKTNGKD